MTGRISEGTAFFPGGSGLYLEARKLNEVEFPVGRVMVLGHNYDSEVGFRNSFLNGGEDVRKGTWKALLDVLKAASVPPEDCFFTNAFMGLCSGSNNKNYRGRGEPDFRAACLTFLKAQIEIQRPRLILTLGVKVPPLLAAASDDLKPWSGRPKSRSCDRELRLKDLDAKPFFESVTFALAEGSTHSCAVTAIAHPSDRRNGAKRLPSGYPVGHEGEIELIRAGWALCRSSKA